MSLAEEQKRAVLELIEQRWRERRQGTLLSEIGILLSKSGQRKSRRRGGASLRATLEAEMGVQVKIIQHPTDPALHAVLPLGVPADAERASLFSRPRGHDLAAAPARFRPAVWAAFVKPINPGHQRYLQFHPVLRFDDLPGAAPKPPGSHVVPTDKIRRPEPDGLNDRQVDDAIRAWAESEKITSDAVFQAGASTTSPPGDTVLHLLLETLPAKDHQRLAIPLDLVRALLRRRVR